MFVRVPDSFRVISDPHANSDSYGHPLPSATSSPSHVRPSQSPRGLRGAVTDRGRAAGRAAGQRHSH